MVLLAALSLQFGAAVAVILLGYVGPLGAVALRLSIAAVLVVCVARPRLGHRDRGDWAVGVAFGLTLGLMNLCFYEAAARLPLGAAVTLEFLGPLGLAVVTSRRARDVAWVALAGLGVLLLSEGGFERLDPVGVAFALGAGSCWAGYILLGSRASRRFPGAEGLAVALVVATVAIAPPALLVAGPALLAPEVWMLGVGVALLSSAVPYTLELAALRRVSPGTFGVLMSLEPAVAALAGFLVLGQLLTPWQLVAIGLVVVASAGATWSSPPQVAPHEGVGPENTTPATRTSAAGVGPADHDRMDRMAGHDRMASNDRIVRHNGMDSTDDHRCDRAE
jgi:inner membrane transporter RhtA